MLFFFVFLLSFFAVCSLRSLFENNRQKYALGFPSRPNYAPFMNKLILNAQEVLTPFT